MLDSNLLRNDPYAIAKKLARRGYNLDVKTLINFEKQRKKIQIETEKLQADRNSISKCIGQLKSRGKDINEFLNQGKILDERLNIVKIELKTLLNKIQTIYQSIPNIPADIVPIGKDSKENLEITRWGTPRKFDFIIRNHIELGKMTGGLDFNAAIKLTSSRFIVMKGQIALMHRALGQFMLDLHTEKNGYKEIYVPYLVNNTSLYGTGQLPKFGEDLFHTCPIKEEKLSNYALIPTAEVPLTNLVRDKILDDDHLPIKIAAHTPCFRSEAGAYGRDTQGLIRMHQFDKVEMVHITRPKDSMCALEELVSHAEKVLRLLNLPYRKVLLCTGDMGFGSKITYDLEVWLPSQATYREISSCSNMGSFQSRRMKARYRSKDNKKIYFVHTLNGSGLAVGRTLVAIMENYQESDGRIAVPKVLQPYMKYLEYIG